MAAEASRDLLFGLLALQNGLINQVALVAAFQAWTLEKSRSLADHLEFRHDLDADDRKMVDALVARHIKKHGGDAEKSLAAMNMDLSTKESLRGIGDPEVEQTLAQVGSGTNGESDRTATYAVGSSTSDGQRFRVLRPHAKGGLGAVFVALDGELNREVALKQILDRHADHAVSRQRFLLEAEITGGLEHPGIVPVYGLGTYADGRPYYAMRFVRGDTLKEASERFHATTTPAGRKLGLQQLLRRFLDVCDAMEYAHRRGVIHRDIKPANIILGKHGETLVVDWGLAKPLGANEPRADGDERTLVPASGSSSVETLPGSALGTPAFMSPEQAAGDLDRLGPATDVYSLGATLYYLLTGRSPFEGDVADVIRAVQNGEFKPPRSLAPWLDRTLEAICLKAMALRPGDRYTSARALAMDLERYFADEPVTAFKEPLRARIARWERRHKLLVYGTVLSLTVLTLGLGTVAAVVADQNRISEKAREEAERQAGLANENLKLAINTAYTSLNTVSDQVLSQIPGMTSKRLSLSRASVTSFEEFLRANGDDPVLLQQAASVYSNSAYTEAAVGDIVKAAQYFRKAIDLRERREKLLGTTLHDAHRAALGEELCRYLFFVQDRGLTSDGWYDFEKYRVRARKLVDDLVAGAPSASVHEYYRFRLAGRLDHIDGQVALDEGEFERARARFARSAERFDLVVKIPGIWFWDRLYLAQAHRGLSRVAHELGQKDVADREMADSLAIIRDVAVANPDQIDPKFVLAWTRRIQAEQLASDPGRSAEADAAIAEACAIADQLHAQFPDEVRYTGFRASALLDRAGRSTARGRDADAERDLVEAHKDLSELVDLKDRDNRDRRVSLGRAETALGRLRLRQGREKEAVELFKSASSRLDADVRERPKNLESKRAAEEARGSKRGQAP